MKEKVNELHAFVNEKVDVVDVKVNDLGDTLQSHLVLVECETPFENRGCFLGGVGGRFCSAVQIYGMIFK